MCGDDPEGAPSQPLDNHVESTATGRGSAALTACSQMTGNGSTNRPVKRRYGEASWSEWSFAATLWGRAGRGEVCSAAMGPLSLGRVVVGVRRSALIRAFVQGRSERRPACGAVGSLIGYQPRRLLLSWVASGRLSR